MTLQLRGKFLFLVFAFFTLSAKTTDIRFTHLSIEQGLSQSTVFCILQDQNGFMWFGTEDGLNRYDGYEFKIFKNDPADSTSLSNNFVTALCQDSAGQIWIGTLRGLCRFNPVDEKFYRYNQVVELKDYYINSICLDHQLDKIWIATSGNGFGYLDIESEKYHPFKKSNNDTGLMNNNVYEIFQDHSGTFWIGTSLGFQKFDPDRGTFSETHLTNGSVRAFIEDQGILRIATYGNGLGRFDPNQNELSFHRHNANDPNGISSDIIMALHQDKSGQLWLGTLDGGLNIFDTESETFTRFLNNPEDQQSISGNFIESIYQNRNGIIWIGNNADGINIYDRHKQKFTSYHNNPDDPNGLSDGVIYSIFEDADEAGKFVWIGTDKGGLNRLNRKTGKYTIYKYNPDDPNSLLHNSIRKIYKDHDGLLWIGTNHGLMIYNKQKDHFEFYRGLKNIFDKLAIRTVFDDPLQPEKYLWIGATGTGLIKFDRETKTTTLFSANPDQLDRLSSTQIRSAYGDESGIIWVGTLGGGLNKLDPKTGAVAHYINDPANPNSLGSNIVLSIYEDRTVSPQILWLGTANGIERFDVQNETFTHFTEKDGLPNNVVYGILGDAHGNLWASTNKGISKFNPETNSFRNFDVNDGLQSDEFNAGAYFKSVSGEMFFGGINGFNIFHPDSIKDNPVIPPVYITSFKKFNKEVEFDRSLFLIDEIQLNYNEDFFSFEFAALNYTAPEKNQYAYKMEGFDRDWIYCGNRRYASYTNLDPGDYTFKVKGSNNDGVWNEAGTSLRIHISHPPWRTWWAYLLYIIGLAFIGSGTRWIIKNRKSILALRKRRISHYRLLELIGKGGMGEVFKAIDLNSKEIVALKLLSPELLQDQENRDRFLREGQLMKTFTHPNIVKTFEFGETENQGYIAMEYLTGGTLQDYLKSSFPLSNTELKRFVEQICDGLQQIHVQGIIHRDIKTANIMLDANKNIRIMDFGLSRSPLAATMTSLGTAMGTLGYVAPEQITNQNVDHRTDIFSLGVVLYELLTNRLPFDGENEMALIHAIFNTVPAPPSSIRSEISTGMDNIISRCLAKNPNERFSAVADLLKDFIAEIDTDEKIK